MMRVFRDDEPKKEDEPKKCAIMLKITKNWKLEVQRDKIKMMAKFLNTFKKA